MHKYIAKMESSWDSEDHTSKFPDETFELTLGACAARTEECSEKFVEAFEAVRWKFDCARNGVDEPTNNDFVARSAPSPLRSFLRGR